jgi:acetyl esterase/lipase
MNVARVLVCASVLVFTAFSTARTAEKPEPIVLWPAGAPGEQGGIEAERDMTKASDGLIAGQPVIRLGNVSVPTITVYPAPPDKATGAAVLVCPGGAYQILAWDLEGTEVCEWLNSIGVAGVLLKYRVPARTGLPRHAAALQDAQRALGVVRQRAGEWRIDPARIGALGFSAGGHLAAALSTNFEKRDYQPIDDADKQSCRPAFVVLVYPGYLVAKEQPDKISPELTITAETPPTLLVQSEDDSIPIENSLFFYRGLKAAHVAAEMHIYPTGGHGYGLRASEHLVTTWPQRAADWMRALGVLRQSN